MTQPTRPIRRAGPPSRVSDIVVRSGTSVEPERDSWRTLTVAYFGRSSVRESDAEVKRTQPSLNLGEARRSASNHARAWSWAVREFAHHAGCLLADAGMPPTSASSSAKLSSTTGSALPRRYSVSGAYLLVIGTLRQNYDMPQTSARVAVASLSRTQSIPERAVTCIAYLHLRHCRDTESWRRVAKGGRQ